ncbi:CHAT domain-containing protein [Phormidium sp. FACHB-592]|nr:CHAT domain-containing protein [Phormidium sp. FACHB-592]
MLICLALFLGTALLPPTFAHAITHPSIAQHLPDAQSLEQQGRQLYETERFSEAVKIWQQAIAALQSNGDTLQQAMALSNLSLAYQQLGQWKEAEQTVSESLNLLQSNQSQNSDRLQILAQALDVQGRLQLSQGKAEPALTTWRQSAEIYTTLGDNTKFIRNQINQAQALQALGLYREAEKVLDQAKQALQKEPDSSLKATGLRSLGNVLRVTGDLEASQQLLQQSLAIAQKLSDPQAVSDALLSLGNAARTQSRNQQNVSSALTFYQQAAATSTSAITRIQAQLNQLSLLIENNQRKEAQALVPQIQTQIERLPANRSTIYARINFSESLIKLSSRTNPNSEQIAQLLATTVQQASALADPRAESYALGTLGKLYERNKQLSDAQALTHRALVIAQAINMPDVAYRWQWQLGRLLRDQGQIEAAIASYAVAVQSLQSLRYDLIAAKSDVQFSFREQIEPVYREYVELLLHSPSGSEKASQSLASNKAAISQKKLQKAREVIESLQLAELDNFFREACLVAKRQIDQVIDQEAQAGAAIYPIILTDRLEVILKLPQQQELLHYTARVSQREVETTINQLRQDLRKPHTLQSVQASSEQLYNWLIRPIAKTLATSQVKTLVFILDGDLRNIPMAVLYDGNQYLVEKYSLALAPGLQLVDPKPLKQLQLRALVAGVSERRSPGFSELPNVPSELQQIKSAVPSQVLLNQQFTSQMLQKQMNSQPFLVVHLATHGQFSSNADQTFVLAWDKPINVNELSNLLRGRDETRPEAIELLVLSACQTAVGDKRAALGIAGVAVRAGARSTLASLWNVNDESTALLMSQFYKALAEKQITKAEALRQAQLALLKNPKFQRPMFWAPYILVGNWL